MLKAIKQWLGTHTVLCLFLFMSHWLLACSQSKVQTGAIAGGQDKELHNQLAIDTVISLLTTGDVVLRAGTGPFSYMLANLNQKDRSYSHCGIVVIEHGYPFVYHCIGGEDNADERLRRDSASFFFSPARNLGIAVVRYDLGDASIKNLVQVVHDYYDARPLFDPKFDLQTDDQLYCSEFVYKAVTKAAHDTSYITKSYGYGRAYIGIDDLYLNSHARVIRKLGYN